MKFRLGALVLGGCLSVQAASLVITNITMVGGAPRFGVQSDLGITNQILCSTNLNGTNWLVLTNLVVTQSPYWFVDVTAPPSSSRFYRVRAILPIIPTNMALIPAGSFTMGDTFGDGASDELPLHEVYVSTFYMDKSEVTKALWDEVYNWATNHGYNFEYGAQGKANTHPAQSMTWYDSVKWCNARSEKEGRPPAYYQDEGLSEPYRSGEVDVQTNWVNWHSGYRLPTEAEWEKAARGGVSGHRFPWGDTDNITHGLANYYAYPASSGGYSYDVSLTSGYHPLFSTGEYPYTSLVGYFTPNGYGLYDMAGNVGEWCWDWYGEYSGGSQTDPLGSPSGTDRVLRGGNWSRDAFLCRVAARYFFLPTNSGNSSLGFRSVLSPAH